MSVYVDDAFIPYGYMKMCHMMADTVGELHRMADRIGVDRKHFQDGRHQHYDICMTKRKLAIDLGAIPMRSKEMVRISLATRKVVIEKGDLRG